MILYLGLDPSRFPRQKGLIHYPVIRTEKILSKELSKALDLWPSFSHVIFTSQTAVCLWFEELRKRNGWEEFNKIWIAIGNATAKKLECYGIVPLVAKDETQEGVVDLLETLNLENAFLGIPKSKKSRPMLTQYLREKKREFFAFDLYDTLTQKLEPIPSLENVEEIVFTSPSTVHAFLKIFGSMPKDKQLTAIGPITEKELNIFLKS